MQNHKVILYCSKCSSNVRNLLMRCYSAFVRAIFDLVEDPSTPPTNNTNCVLAVIDCCSSHNYGSISKLFENTNLKSMFSPPKIPLWPISTSQTVKNWLHCVYCLPNHSMFSVSITRHMRGFLPTDSNFEK